MISIKLSQIPCYLHGSDLFGSLNRGDPDECIQVPHDCCKTDTTILNPASLTHMLSTIRYWGVRELPSDVVSYLLHTHHDIMPVLTIFDNGLRLYDCVAAMRDTDSISEWWCIAAKSGRPELLQRFVQGGYGYSQRFRAFIVAAENGHVSCMQTIAQSMTKLERDSYISGIQEAREISCANGHAKCVEYAHSLGATLKGEMMIKAAEQGRPECMAYLYNYGLDFQLADAVAAAAHGHAGCLEVVLLNSAVRSKDICVAAAGAGHLQCLQLACTHGCTIDTAAAVAAAQSGHIDCLMFAAEQGAVLDNTVTEAACRGGSMLCLRYALEQGCPLTERCIFNAANAGHLECLTYLHEELGRVLDEQVLLAAAWGGHLSCLQYIHSKVGDSVCSVASSAAAAAGGSVECLRFLREVGCPWDHTAAIQAAMYGRAECARYIVANGGEVTAAAVNAAVGFDTRVLLSYAYLNK